MAIQFYLPKKVASQELKLENAHHQDELQSDHFQSEADEHEIYDELILSKNKYEQEEVILDTDREFEIQESLGKKYSQENKKR